jgi:hypothetical protein
MTRGRPINSATATLLSAASHWLHASSARSTKPFVSSHISHRTPTWPLLHCPSRALLPGASAVNGPPGHASTDGHWWKVVESPAARQNPFAATRVASVRPGTLHLLLAGQGLHTPFFHVIALVTHAFICDGVVIRVAGAVGTERLAVFILVFTWLASVAQLRISSGLVIPHWIIDTLFGV